MASIKHYLDYLQINLMLLVHTFLFAASTYVTFHFSVEFAVYWFEHMLFFIMYSGVDDCELK